MVMMTINRAIASDTRLVLTGLVGSIVPELIGEHW